MPVMICDLSHWERGLEARVPRVHKRALSENERADEILRRAGLLAELPPEQKACRWTIR